MNEDLIVVPVVFGTFCWIIWVVFSSLRRYKIAKMHAQTQTRLLEKFGSSQELLAYMQTDAGRQFLNAINSEQRTPHSRILDASQTGSILIVSGIALLLLRAKVPEGERILLVSGGLVLSLGLGFAISAVVTYILSKAYGLLSDSSRR